MSRKHYIAVAATFRAQFIELERTGNNNDATFNALRNIAEELAAQFANDNKNFNRTKFLEACNVR